MDISPTPVPPDRAADNERARSARVSYDWDAIILNEWQNWLEITEHVSNQEAMRRCTRIRVAAINHAAKNGLKVESRRTDRGRTLDLKFTRLTTKES